MQFLLIPLGDMVTFALLYGAAVWFRRKPLAHKSLMLLTAINFLPPAIGRIPVPSLQALGPIWFLGVPTLLMLVCVVLDWRQRGRVNVVLALGSALLLASYIVRLAAMATEPWLRFAEWLTGV